MIGLVDIESKTAWSSYCPLFAKVEKISRTKRKIKVTKRLSPTSKNESTASETQVIQCESNNSKDVSEHK